jgi:ATP-binding cassette subfamily C protein
VAAGYQAMKLDSHMEARFGPDVGHVIEPSDGVFTSGKIRFRLDRGATRSRRCRSGTVHVLDRGAANGFTAYAAADALQALIRFLLLPAPRTGRDRQRPVGGALCKGGGARSACARVGRLTVRNGLDTLSELAPFLSHADRRATMRSRDGIADFIRLVWTGTRGAFAKAAILQTLGSLSEIVSILLLIPLLRLLDPSRNEILVDLNWLPFVASDQALAITLPMIIGAFVAATILRSLLLETKERYNARVMFGFVADFQHQLFKAVTLTRWQVLGRYRTADLTQVLTSNIDRLLMATHQLLQLVQSALMTVIFALASLAISWRMTLAAIVIGVGVFAFTYRARRRSFEHGQTVGRQRRDEFRLVDGFLGGLRTAKLFGLQQQHLSAMDEVLARIYRPQYRPVCVGARAQRDNLSDADRGGGRQLHLRRADLPDARTPHTARHAVPVHASRAAHHVAAFGQPGTRRQPRPGQRRRPSFCRPAAKTPSSPCRRRAAATSRLDRGIELSQIEFRYGPEDAPTLDRVSAFIPAHAITAISGPSGSGKSTLLDIISGLLPPASGKMMVDGLALDDER